MRPSSRFRLLRLSALLLSSLLGSAAISAAEPAFPIEEVSITELTAAYTSGKTSVRAVVQAHLDRIAAYDPLLGAIVVVNPQALANADKLDATFKSTGKPVGPLHGIPVLVKDNYDVAGLPTTGGSAALIGWIPTKDSTAVARLRAAGAVILAKTTMSEWARGGLDNINSVLPGFARNPYNLPYATGGSSGGTGSGVAASLGVAGLGSDTFGSIRNPSSNNALVGLRPSWALVPRTGMVGLYDARDTAGPMARSVTDLVRLLDVIAGPDAADPATTGAAGKIPATYATALTRDGLRGKRLGVLRQAFPSKNSDSQVLALINRAIADLRAQGAEIIDPFIVPEFDQFPAQSHPQSEVRAAIEKYLATTGPAFPKTVADVLASKKVHPLHESGLLLSSKAPAPSADPIVTALLASEAAMRVAYLRAMDAAKIDALILPVASFPPKLNGDRNTTPTGVTTWIASGLHWPALSVPMGTTHDNLPSGLQIVGRPWSELTILSLGYAYEQSTHHRLPPPTTPPLATSFAQKFIGTWKLVAVRERDPATGTEKPAARDALDGQLLYAANGRLSVQIIRQGREKSAPNTTDGFSSYFGTWKLLPAEGCVVHQQDGNLNQAQAGQAAKRYFSFDATDLLSLATPPRRATPEAPELSTVFVWRRLP